MLTGIRIAVGFYINIQSVSHSVRWDESQQKYTKN